jgi:hypothetical protein
LRAKRALRLAVVPDAAYVAGWVIEKVEHAIGGAPLWRYPVSPAEPKRILEWSGDFMFSGDLRFASWPPRR